MATLELTVKFYMKEKARREEARRAEEEQERVEAEQFTKEAFEKIELSPVRIDGRCAYFEYQGEEIQLLVSRWKSGAIGVCRVLGPCQRCESILLSDEYELQLDNVGWLLCEPQKRWHECWVSVQHNEPVLVEKTNAERLVDLINELIDERVAQIQG